LKPAFELIVFDLDGTLVDSRQGHRRVGECGAGGLRRAAVERGGARTDGWRRRPHTHRSRVCRVGVEPPPDALDRFLTIYNHRLLRHTRPYAGIPELLDQLGRRAFLAVLTNKPLAAAHRILAGLDLSQYFPADRVVGGDGPFKRKPDPAGLAHLMASVGASPGATALVGDSVVDWRTAAAAATHVVMARYGFGFEGFPPTAWTRTRGCRSACGNAVLLVAFRYVFC
jgi:phosphoglycolate phosphatase